MKRTPRSIARPHGPAHSPVGPAAFLSQTFEGAPTNALRYGVDEVTAFLTLDESDTYRIVAHALIKPYTQPRRLQVRLITLRPFCGSFFLY